MAFHIFESEIKVLISSVHQDYLSTREYSAKQHDALITGCFSMMQQGKMKQYILHEKNLKFLIQYNNCISTLLILFLIKIYQNGCLCSIAGM